MPSAVKARALLVRPDGTVRAPWRLAFFVLASYAVGVIGFSVLYPLLAPLGVEAWARRAGVPLDQWAIVLALLAGTFAALRIVDGARSSAWSRVDLGVGSLHWRALVIGAVAGAAAILLPSALMIGFGWLRRVSEPASVTWGEAAVAAAMLLTPAALLEELVFRGYLLTVLRDSVRLPAAVVITSVLFALMHLFNPGVTLRSTAMVALAGVFLATVRLATRSLYAAWLAHLAWNFAQASILHVPVSGLSLPTPGYRYESSGPEWLTGGSWGPEGGLAAAASMLALTFLIAWRPNAPTPSSVER